MDKKSRDNRANQLNPNNDEFYKSRGLTPPKHKGLRSRKPSNRTEAAIPTSVRYAAALISKRKGITALTPGFAAISAEGVFIKTGTGKYRASNQSGPLISQSAYETARKTVAAYSRRFVATPNACERKRFGHNPNDKSGEERHHANVSVKACGQYEADKAPENIGGNKNRHQE